eukprot:363442-Chlamydomonas_euryale.AAC.4
MLYDGVESLRRLKLLSFELRGVGDASAKGRRRGDGDAFNGRPPPAPQAPVSRAQVARRAFAALSELLSGSQRLLAGCRLPRGQKHREPVANGTPNRRKDPDRRSAPLYLAPPLWDCDARGRPRAKTSRRMQAGMHSCMRGFPHAWASAPSNNARAARLMQKQGMTGKHRVVGLAQ